MTYRDRLLEGAKRYHCDIHAYVLMTNHVHILATPSDSIGIARMMQYIGRRYVPCINQTYGTSGFTWEGRYKASLVQEEYYLLNYMRYIELNPVRAKGITAYNTLLTLIRRIWRRFVRLGKRGRPWGMSVFAKK